MSFKNKREIYQALIDGKKIQNRDWGSSRFIYFNKEGEVVTEEGYEYRFLADYPNQWQEYKEPKKITLYRYTYKSVTGDIYQTDWMSRDLMTTSCLLKTESKEIDIEE